MGEKTNALDEHEASSVVCMFYLILLAENEQSASGYRTDKKHEGLLACIDASTQARLYSVGVIVYKYSYWIFTKHLHLTVGN